MTITSSSPFVMIKLAPWPLGLTTLLIMILFHGVQFSHRDGSVEAFHSSKVSNHFRDCYFFIAKTTRGGKIMKLNHCSYDKKEKYRRIWSSFPLFDSNNSRDESQQGAGLSIGDVVQNLHGGKYQFSETQYLAGQSVIGQQFANELYSGSSECDNYLEGSDDEEEGNELPKWVKRLKDPKSHVGKPISEVLEFDSKNDLGVSSVNIATISIKNEERSWEKYYAFIIPFLENVDRNGANAINQISQESGDFADNLKFQIISPKSGYLAPRGGASNACDESKPYSDGASVTIQWDGMIGEDYNSRRDDESSLLLVVGTEAEIWRYRLKVV